MSVGLAKELAEEAVREIAGHLGVKLEAEQVVELAGKAVVHIGDLISAKAWRDARAVGDAAAERITTLEQAEESARKPR